MVVCGQVSTTHAESARNSKPASLRALDACAPIFTNNHDDDDNTGDDSDNDNDYEKEEGIDGDDCGDDNLAPCLGRLRAYFHKQR